ncbi:MAG: hypothetical protein Pyrs2KO_26650 [Pyruvatibacter sp.]
MSLSSAPENQSEVSSNSDGLDFDLTDIEQGGNPGTRKYSLVTALFGWGALLSFVGIFVAASAGWLELSAAALASASTCLWIAMRRDLVSLLLTGKMS